MRNRPFALPAVGLRLLPALLLCLWLPGCPRASPPAGLEGRLKEIVEHLSSDIGERNTARYEALLESERYLTQELVRAGYEVKRQEFSSEGRAVANLVAELPGSREILVVGAHYDSARGTPGANDNASGVAALLVLAQRLRDSSLERTLRFVLFVNEEPPFFQGPSMGSRIYARSLRDQGQRVVGMLSLETMGWYTDAEGSQRIPPGVEGDFPRRGNFLALVSRLEDAAFLGEVEGALRASSDFPAQAVAAKEDLSGIGWSDHWSFWQEGYPAAMATDTAPFRYDHYHSPKDTPEQLNYPAFARAVQGLEGALRRLAGGRP